MMRLTFLLLLALTGTARAADCPVRQGTAAQWSTDLCLLQVGATAPDQPAAKGCAQRVTVTPDSCEWRVAYKQQFCSLLIQRAAYQGALEACVADRTIRGPTVRGKWKR